MKIAVTGSTGLIGTAVVGVLRREGHQVIRLVRRPPGSADEISWDARAAGAGLAPGALDGVDAVVHLAGASIDRRWTPSYQAEIRASRVQGTRGLVAGLTAMNRPPAVLLSGSGIHWYGDTGEREVDESAPNGAGFLAGVVRDWEAAAEPATQAGIRVVNLRTGMVLSPRGGILARMLLPFRLGLGARLGSGRQMMSWITLPDYTGIVSFLLAHQEISGPVNMVTPNPVTNAEFTSALAAALHRPAMLALPTQALTLVLGAAATDLFASIRVRPGTLQAAGYRYRHPEVRAALSAIVAAETAA